MTIYEWAKLRHIFETKFGNTNLLDATKMLLFPGIPITDLDEKQSQLLKNALRETYRNNSPTHEN